LPPAGLSLPSLPRQKSGIHICGLLVNAFLTSGRPCSLHRFIRLPVLKTSECNRLHKGSENSSCSHETATDKMADRLIAVKFRRYFPKKIKERLVFPYQMT
jgi:hypothetical protein